MLLLELSPLLTGTSPPLSNALFSFLQYAASSPPFPQGAYNSFLFFHALTPLLDHFAHFPAVSLPLAPPSFLSICPILLTHS